MRALVREAMGRRLRVDHGLFYVPAIFSTIDELVELAKVAGEMGGIHISHIRDEESGVEASVRETIAIGERGGLPTQVTHHKTIGSAAGQNHRHAPARGRSTPSRRQRDGRRVSVSRIGHKHLGGAHADVGTGRHARRHREAPARPGDEAPNSRRHPSDHPRRQRRGRSPQYHGVSMRLESNAGRQAARRCRCGEGTLRSGEDAADTALWLVENGDCGGIYFAISEDDIQRVLRHPASMVASDGQVVLFGRANPHPRSYGTFARVLGRYVRELNTLSLEDAIRKMSSYPAQRIGLMDRGVLRERMKADIVIFDAAAVRDAATFEQPHQYAQGVSVVVINGHVAFENGTMSAARPGRILYGRGYDRR